MYNIHLVFPTAVVLNLSPGIETSGEHVKNPPGSHPQRCNKIWVGPKYLFFQEVRSAAAAAAAAMAGCSQASHAVH